MRKGQMEILGLAIVVVIVIIATVFVVKFLIVKAPTDYRKGFVSKELATNMINTLLKTTAQDCSQMDMTELLQDCAQAGGIICSNGKNSCDFVEDATKNIFSQTLDKWNFKYEFKAYINEPSQFLIPKIGQPCKSDKKAGLFSIPTNVGNIYVSLDICL